MIAIDPETRALLDPFGFDEARLAAAAAALAALFADHLALEERTIFPAIAALPADVQATIRAEMLARRR